MRSEACLPAGPADADQTRAQDYHADAGDPGVEEERTHGAPAHA